MELFVDVEHGVGGILRVADLNVVVVPAEFLVGLHARQELGTCPKVSDTGN